MLLKLFLFTFFKILLLGGRLDKIHHVTLQLLNVSDRVFDSYPMTFWWFVIIYPDVVVVLGLCEYVEEFDKHRVCLFHINKKGQNNYPDVVIFLCVGDQRFRERIFFFLFFNFTSI